MQISRGNGVLIGATLVIIAIGSRLLPHWHNFTAVGAAGLFGAYYFRKQIWAFIIPLLAMWMSDLLLNNWIYSAFNPEFVWFTDTMLFVYFGFILLVLTGQLFLTKLSGMRVLGASITVSIVFFLISNFGSFIQDPLYPKNGSGVIMAYVAGLPFFWNTLIANVVYSLMLFGIYQWVSERYPSLKIA